MRRIDQKRFVVDGYQFETERQYKQAKKELDGIRYTKENLNMSNPEEVLSVYNRILRDKLFTTPVGYSYLRELQEYLLASPVIQKKDVHPIDFQPVIERAKEEDREAIAIKKKRVKEEYKEEGRRRKQKEKVRRKEQTANNGTAYRSKYISSVIINIALVLVVIAMFVIMKLSDVPTIVDYENKLIDKYEKWEQELQEREDRIREYENGDDISGEDD